MSIMAYFYLNAKITFLMRPKAGWPHSFHNHFPQVSMQSFPLVSTSFSLETKPRLQFQAAIIGTSAKRS
jgi:hypothetical protein